MERREYELLTISSVSRYSSWFFLHNIQNFDLQYPQFLVSKKYKYYECGHWDESKKTQHEYILYTLMRIFS